MAVQTKNLFQGFRDFQLIFNNQDATPAGFRRDLRRGLDHRRHRGVRGWQVDNEPGAALGRIRDADPPAMGLYNTVAYGKAYPGPHPGWLGGEKRIEYARAHIRRHAGPDIVQSHGHHLGRRIERRCNRQSTRFGRLHHRLLGIHQQIRHNLVKLVGITPDKRQVCAAILNYLNSGRAQGITHKFQCVIDQYIDVHRALFRRLLARHRQKRLDDPGTTFGRRTDVLCALDDFSVAVGLFHQHRLRNDDGKRIVQLMRHAGQKRPQGAQFLALMQRLALAPDFRLRLLGIG